MEEYIIKYSRYYNRERFMLGKKVFIVTKEIQK